MVRNEYPRPNFVREQWMSLNGEWQFDFDDQDTGIVQGYSKYPQLTKTINVPYTYQSKLSGINIQDFHDVVWYQKEFNLLEEMKNKHIILYFGAVDYKADVWVNGEHLISHEGGHTPFSVDITHVLEETNIIVVRAEDPSHDLELPRGKQYWKEKSEGIFYTRTTGIWQSVWLEAVNETHLDSVMITPDLDQKKVQLEYEYKGPMTDVSLNVKISLNDVEFINDTIQVKNGRGKRDFWFDQQLTLDMNHHSYAWSPENPVLFDVTYTTYKNNECIDQVTSYIGLRKVEVVDGMFMLNNRPYFQKLVLDQGYWEDSLLTAPTDEDYVKDIQLTKSMGFNGVRKHQKVEDPRYLYWADKLGLLVWGEMANAYTYSRTYANRMTSEWMNVIKRDYNHPCIVAWTPINESWGADCILTNKDEQAHATAMYWLTKSLDQTRLVISNDGWEHTQSDLLTIHDYAQSKDVLEKRYEKLETITSSYPVAKALFASGWSYQNQPIIISEMGGISYQKSDWMGWGYASANSDEDFIQKYYNVVTPMLQSKHIQGFCYTQITDVEQEINGLLTYRREPKIDVDIIKAINEGTYKK